MPDYERIPDRDESRYVLDASSAAGVHSRFGRYFNRVVYSNPVTQTAHLAGKELDHPASYLRIRRYSPVLDAEVLTLDPDDPWFFEHKQTDGVKERIRQPLGEILLGTTRLEVDAFAATLPSAGRVLQEFGKPVMPVFVTQSLRTHYQAPGARLTVDQKRSYYGIRWGELEAYRLGSLPAIQAELKVEETMPGVNAEGQFNEICQQLGGVPASDDEIGRDMFAAYVKFIEAG